MGGLNPYKANCTFYHHLSSKFHCLLFDITDNLHVYFWQYYWWNHFHALYFVHITKTYFDPSPLTALLGSYTSRGNNSISSHDGILGAASSTGWKHKSRLFHADSMSTGLLSKVWSKCFIAFACLFAVVAIGAAFSDANKAAVQNGDTDSVDPIINFPPNATYYYNEPEPGQPTCRLDHKPHRMIQDEETFPILYLSDYVLLSSIAYYHEDAIQPLVVWSK